MIIVSAIVVICAADAKSCNIKLLARTIWAAAPKTSPISVVAALLVATSRAFWRSLCGALPATIALARAVVKLAEEVWLEEREVDEIINKNVGTQRSHI